MKRTLANAAFSGVSEPNFETQTGVYSAEKVTPSLPGIETRRIVMAPVRAWHDEVVAQLDELMKLPIGWDGYRAAPVSFQTANFALRMLENVCGENAPAPQVVPGCNGDVQFEWHTERGEIELHVLAANRVRAWRMTEATGPDGEERELNFNFMPIVGWFEELSGPAANADTAAA